jgi:drug/metabolite transporter (DMT)-like permease
MSVGGLAAGGREDVLRGIVFCVTAFFFFACMDALAKYLGGSYHWVQLVFFRALFGFLPVLPVVYSDGGLRALRTRHPILHLIRSAAVLVALATYFIGLQYMPLAEALTLAFTSPLFVTLLSIPLLGERVGSHRLLAILAGFAGVLVIMRPGADAFKPEAFYLLVAGAAFALSSVLTRLLGRTETNGAIIFYSTLGQFLPTALVLPFVWQMPASLTDWLLFVGMGCLGGIGLQLITLAFRNAQASVLAPFEYTTLIWATLIGWMVWREWPGNHVWIGAAILVATGLYITYREGRLRQTAV